MNLGTDAFFKKFTQYYLSHETIDHETEEYYKKYFNTQAQDIHAVNIKSTLYSLVKQITILVLDCFTPLQCGSNIAMYYSRMNMLKSIDNTEPYDANKLIYSIGLLAALRRENENAISFILSDNKSTGTDIKMYAKICSAIVSEKIIDITNDINTTINTNLNKQTPVINTSSFRP